MKKENLTYLMEELARFGFGPYPAVDNDDFVPVTSDSAIKEELGRHKEVGDHLQSIGYWDNLKNSERTMFVGANAVRFQLKYEKETAADKSFETAMHLLEYKKDTLTDTLSFEKHACYIDNSSQQEGYPKCHIFRSDDVLSPSIAHAFEITKMIAIEPNDIKHYLEKKLGNKEQPMKKKNPVIKNPRRKGPGLNPK